MSDQHPARKKPTSRSCRSKKSLAWILNEEIARKKRWNTPSTLPRQERVLDVYRNDYSVSCAHVRVDGEPIGLFYTGAGHFARARAEIADNYEADAALMLAQGSTGGNQVIAAYLTLTGSSPVLVARTFHHSTLDSLVMHGHTFYFLPPGEYLSEYEAMLPPTAEQVRTALKLHGDTRTVFVNSPTYEGRIADIAAIADVAHEFDCDLVVDAAWGGHFPFSDQLPDFPTRLGADLVVTSTHKCAGSLQAGALVLAAGDRVDYAALCEAHAEVATTSPPAAVLTSIVSAQAELKQNGEEHIDRLLTHIARVKSRVAQKLPNVSILDVDDETKLTLGLANLDITGYDLKQSLLEYDIVPEKAGANSITFVATFALPARAGDELGDALVALLEDVRTVATPARHDPFVALADRPVIPPAMTRTLSRRYKVALEEAVGFVAAQRVELYPPGIPVIVPGFRITQDAIDLLLEAEASGGTIAVAGEWEGHVTVVPTAAERSYLAIKRAAE